MADFSGYLSQDTIAARVTGAGGAISMIRLSGPRALEHLSRLSPETTGFAHRQIERVRLSSADGKTLDDAMAVFYRAPHTFTGEDVAEIFLHGGSFVVSFVLQELFEQGCRQALPGEFSFRAVRNGKLTLDQAQAVHDLISATNGVAHELALERLSGAQSRAFTQIAESLRSLITLAEAGIDFSDQDLEELELERLKSKLQPVAEKLRRISASIDRGRRIQEGVSVVLAGLPNAGKSSLFNELLGQDRSLISEEAGTTRDIVREGARLRSKENTDEATFIFHDTAGLRETNGNVERLGIELTRGAVASSDIVLFVVEPGSHQHLIRQEWKQLGEPKDKSILVLNKLDRLDSRSADEISREMGLWKALLGVEHAVAVSARDQLGIETCIQLLLDRARAWVGRSPSEVVLTRQEQVDAVNRALSDLERARVANAHDMFAADVRQSLDNLSFFIGSTSVDDVLGRIFSQFCIGK